VAWTREDAIASDLTGVTSATATLALAVNAGDLLIGVAHSSFADPPTQPFSDNVNGTWPVCDGVWDSLPGGSSGRTYTAHITTQAAGAGALTTTVLGNASATRTRLIVTRWSCTAGQLYSLAAVVEGTGSASPFTSGLTGTPAGAGDLVIGIAQGANGPGTTFTAGTDDGASHAYTAGLTVDRLFEEYILNASASTKKATGTESDVEWLAAVLIFNASQSGGGTGGGLFWDSH